MVMEKSVDAPRAEWRVIREIRNDEHFIVVEISKRCRNEYSFRVARCVDRGFTESLMPFIHVHVRGGKVPRFDDAVIDLLEEARQVIKEDVASDEKRMAANDRRHVYATQEDDDEVFDD